MDALFPPATFQINLVEEEHVDDDIQHNDNQHDGDGDIEDSEIGGGEETDDADEDGDGRRR